jgi:hypothetical protein
MGDPFSNWYGSSQQARTYHDSVVREADKYRSVQIGLRRSLASRALDHLGRVLITLGRVLRRTAGQYVMPEDCGCHDPVIRT